MRNHTQKTKQQMMILKEQSIKELIGNRIYDKSVG